MMRSKIQLFTILFYLRFLLFLLAITYFRKCMLRAIITCLIIPTVLFTRELYLILWIKNRYILLF